jgi:DNA-binding SARP family transcriptional activator
VEFRILGPLEVVDGESPLPLGGPKQRALLLVLLLHAREVVSMDVLADALWSGAPPRTAATAIQNFVSELRKVLGSERLVTKTPGYVLLVDDEELDATRVDRLVARARSADPEKALTLLSEAESLWRGPPLADVAYESFAQPAVARLEELRTSVREDRIDAALAIGRDSQVIAELEGLVAEQPLRERSRAQLMTALYRMGRQAEALHVYQEGRRLLTDELGLEPGPALKELHRQILRQERALAPAVSRDGGEDGVERAARALQAGRLVSVLGAPTVELARRLGDLGDVPASHGRELPRVAQYVAVTSGAGPLHDELRDLLTATLEPTEVHRLFARLATLLRERGAAPQLIVTTAYDLTLEDALLEAGEAFDVVWYLSSGPHRGKFCHLSPEGKVRVIDVPNRYADEVDPDRRTVVLKLHGGLDRTPERTWESFVITEDDFIDYLPPGGLGRAVPVSIAARLRRSHFLFLGYGASEWNLRLVLNRLWGGSTVNYRSWAVVDSGTPLERAMWRSRDVDVVDVPVEKYLASLAQQAALELEVAQ